MIKAILESKGISVSDIILVQSATNTGGWKDFKESEITKVYGHLWQLEHKDLDYWEFQETYPSNWKKDNVWALFASLKHNFISDSLYNCYEGGRYAQGVLVGMVSAFMSSGCTFEAALTILKVNFNRKNKFDLTEQMIIDCLPENWKADWRKIKV